MFTLLTGQRGFLMLGKRGAAFLLSEAERSQAQCLEEGQPEERGRSSWKR